MGTVRARIDVEGRASEAETLWYDAKRWPTWLDGFGTLDRVSDEWPQVGARAVWTSVPGGRGRVIEEVVAYEARRGQTVAVEDEQIRGHQTISFEPGDDAVRIELVLEYERKQSIPVLGALTDAVFIRRAFRDALDRTLRRFARELRDERRAAA